MKALRYLLIAIVVMLTALPAGAQYSKVNSVAGCTTFGQTDRQYQFHTTSTMLYADDSSGMGSTAFSTGVSTGKPLFLSIKPRKDIGGGGATEDEDTPPEDPEDPFPVGEGTWFLLLLAAAYASYIFRRRMVVQAECIENK